MTALILFGAGASFGSEPITVPTPPLGDQLFDQLEKLSPIAKAIPEVIKENSEKILKVEWPSTVT